MINSNQEKRNKWFDLLLGGFLISFLWNHYAQTLSVWYMKFFKESNALSAGLYQSHQKMLGIFLPPDQFSLWAGQTVFPWLGGLFLSLLAFRLAEKTQEEFTKSWSSHLKYLSLILLFFIGENFMTATYFGEAVSLSPIISWFLVLGLIGLLYRFMGFTGVVFLLVLSLMRWWIPTHEFLEPLLQKHIHPLLKLHHGIQHFTAIGALGFLLGYLYHHKFVSKFPWGLIGAGIILTVVGHYLSPNISSTAFEIYKDDNLKTATLWGTLEILGAQMVLITGALWAHTKQLTPPKVLRPLVWLGFNALAILAFHQIVFLQIWMPLSTWICAYLNTTLPNNIGFIGGAILTHLGFCYWLIKSQVLRIVMRN